jgi:hypothetical protein
MKPGRNLPGNGPELLTAAEIAAFVYCPEQWRLEYGLGLEPGNRAALVVGNRHHARKAMAERVAGGDVAVGRFLAIIAAVVLLLLLWRWSLASRPAGSLWGRCWPCCWACG